MKMSCIKFLNNVVSSLHMHYFGGCSLRYVKYICALPPRPARTLNFFSRPYVHPPGVSAHAYKCLGQIEERKVGLFHLILRY